MKSACRFWFCSLVAGLGLLFSASAMAWYPQPGYSQVFPGTSPYSYMTPWQSRYTYPWAGSFYGYRGPWGNMNGGINPDGSFWINIRFGGTYQDLQTLIALMQMSASMRMNY